MQNLGYLHRKDKMKQYVTGFMYSQDKKRVVLIEKINPEWQRGLLNGVGGKIEENETPEVAMSREFKEETGISTLPEEWKLFSIINRPSKYKVYFLYTFNNSLINAKTVEEEQVGIYEVDNLPSNTIYNLKWFIPMSLDPMLSFLNPVQIVENI